MGKIFGGRVPAVRRRSRANYQNFLVQNCFPVTRGLGKNFPDRGAPEKISQTAMRIVRGRLLCSYRSEGGGNGPPGPLRLEGVRGVPYARHTFCNSGKFRFFSGRVPAPLRVLDPYARHTFCNSGKFRFFSDEAPNARHTFCNSGKFGPSCYGARMEKKLGAFVCHFIAHQSMRHFMVHLKSPQLPRAKHHFGILKKSPRVAPKNFTCNPQIFSLLS